MASLRVSTDTTLDLRTHTHKHMLSDVPDFFCLFAGEEKDEKGWQGKVWNTPDMFEELKCQGEGDEGESRTKRNQ